MKLAKGIKRYFLNGYRMAAGVTPKKPMKLGDFVEKGNVKSNIISSSNDLPGTSPGLVSSLPFLGRESASATA